MATGAVASGGGARRPRWPREGGQHAPEAAPCTSYTTSIRLPTNVHSRARARAVAPSAQRSVRWGTAGDVPQSLTRQAPQVAAAVNHSHDADIGAVHPVEH